MHHPNETTNQTTLDRPRPAQCLRHHVWMAACPECREARLAGQRVTAPR